MNQRRPPNLSVCLLIALGVLPPAVLADGDFPDATSFKSKAWWGPSEPPRPPLDTNLLFARKGTPNPAACPGCTEQVLSLLYEQPAGTAYPWLIYGQLDTSHSNGDAVGVYSRTYARGAGWSASFHAEPIVYGSGTTIGVNTEVSPMVANASTVGINLQAKNGYGGDARRIWSGTGIQLQSDDAVGWDTGIRFEKVVTNTGLDFSAQSSGQRAIRVRGNYPVAMAVAAGQKVCFEPTEKICFRFNPTTNRLQLLNGDRVVTTFATGAPGS